MLGMKENGLQGVNYEEKQRRAGRAICEHYSFSVKKFSPLRAGHASRASAVLTVPAAFPG